MKKDAYYFLHFSNARNDAKIIKLRRVLGLEGYAIYFMLLEILREQTDFKYNLNGIEDLAYEWHTSKEKIAAVIHNFELFEIIDNMFFSSKLILYLQPYIEKSERARKAVEIRWNKIRNDIEIQKNNDTNADTNVYTNADTNVSKNDTNADTNVSKNDTNADTFVIQGEEKRRKEKRREDYLCPKNKNFLDFYNNQFIENQNEPLIKEYEYLFKYLLNEIKNEINKPLEWLKLEQQLSYFQFAKLKEISIQKNVKIMDMIKLGENVPSYLLKKKKISVYLTLRNWLNSNINYSNYTKNQQTNNLLTMKNPYKNEITQLKQHN